MISWRAVLTNTGAQLLAKGLTAASTLLLFAILARQFPSSAVAVYSLVLNVVFMAIMVVDWGMNAIVVRRFGQERKDSVLAETLVARVILALGIAIGLFFLTLLLVSHPRTQAGFPPIFFLGTLILLPSLFAHAILLTLAASFQYHLRYARYAIAVASGAGGTILLLVLLFFFNASLTSYFFLPLIASVVSAGIAIRLAHHGLFNWRSIPVDRAISLIRQSFPLALTMIINVLYLRVDSFLLSTIRGLTEVANYNIAMTLMTNAIVIPTFMMNAIYPQLVRIQHTARFRTVIRTIVFQLSILGVGAAIVGWILGPLAVRIWVGEEYAMGMRAIRILSIGFPFYFLTPLTMALLILSHRRWTIAIIYTIGFLMNLVGNILLQPHYGYRAAAWLTVGAEWFILVASVGMLALFLYKKKT